MGIEHRVSAANAISQVSDYQAGVLINCQWIICSNHNISQANCRASSSSQVGVRPSVRLTRSHLNWSAFAFSTGGGGEEEDP